MSARYLISTRFIDHPSVIARSIRFFKPLNVLDTLSKCLCMLLLGIGLDECFDAQVVFSTSVVSHRD